MCTKLGPQSNKNSTCHSVRHLATSTAFTTKRIPNASNLQHPKRRGSIWGLRQLPKALSRNESSRRGRKMRKTEILIHQTKKEDTEEGGDE